MSRFRSPRLILPPREEDEIYPYRRVWRSLLIENGVLAALLVGLYALVAFVGLRVPSAFAPAVNLLLVALPVLLWVWFSWLQELAVPQPRVQLGAVFVLSALVAQAVGVPLVTGFLQPDQWLSLDSAVNRIIGYTVTAGITQELLKYLIMRVVVRPALYRVRTDVLAYSVAVALGYSTILSFNYLQTTPDVRPDMLLLRVVTFQAILLAGSAIVSYGLMELYLGSGSLALLPASLLAAALVTGIAMPLRSGLISPQLTLEGSGTRTIFGIGFALALLIVPQVFVAFLYDVSERREKDRQRSET